MPITTLNKVINLFLVGGVAVFFIGLLHWQQFKSLAMGGAPSGDSEFWVVAALLFFPVTALLGAVIEGISGFTVQALLKKSRTSSRVAKVFLQHRAKDCLSVWRERLLIVAKDDQKYKWLLESDPQREEPWFIHSAAAGIFLQSAGPGHLEWLVQHYSTYVLASNMGLVVAATYVYIPFARIVSGLGLWWPVLAPLNLFQVLLVMSALLVSFWSLCVFGVGRYLYSHEYTARHFALWLGDERLGCGD